MSQPKQNAPCPCGSEKKYIKCCGLSNIIKISPQFYNDELDQLHDDLLDYALENYEELFIEQTRIYFQPFLNNDMIAVEDYLTGLTLWTILNEPVLNNDQTIFVAFYNQQKCKIKRTRTRKTLLEWVNSIPSVYEVLSAVNAETNLATIVEISTNKQFQIPMIDGDEYTEGSILIGSLVPFVGYHNFFFDVIEVFEADKKRVLDLLEKFPSDKEQFSKAFPDFLAEILLFDVDEVPDYLLDDEVANLFRKHMIDKGLDPKIRDMNEIQESQSPRDQAQDLLYEAKETSGKKRRYLIAEALSIYPNSPDAYLLLANETNTEFEFWEMLNKAVQVGEKDLGKAFFLEHKGHFWMMHETRPYMRAKEIYANFLFETGAEEQALIQYEEMLQLNPNDHQGIRYNLLTLYIEFTDYQKAQDLINNFNNESTASFLFNKIIVDFLLNGFTSQTKTFIKEANMQNPFVKDYLQREKKLSHKYPNQIGFGDETEAIVYTQEHIHLWQAYPELLKEL